MKRGNDMTVNEYREKHPDCEYCKHHYGGFDKCIATNKRMNKRTAKKCRCYKPDKFTEGKTDDLQS